MSGRWMEERKRDLYRRMAREQGYRSRAAFKLKEIDKRFGIFNDAKVVLDLGAAPGGWLQVASEAVGKEGLVIGIDLKPIKSLGLENVKTVVGDVTENSTLEEVRRLLPDPVDALLSDLSPQVSGTWDVDQLLQIELTRSALRFAEEFLRSDGWVVLKVFQGMDTQSFLEDLRKRLGYMKIFKPKASRKRSAEIYVVGRFLKKGRE
jgi:23S rRNA (uridine2552-2'-O)-methyltransferase